MRTTHLGLDVPPPFDFRAAATSHGWVVLAPNGWLAERQVVQRVERLPGGKVVLLAITGAGTVERPTIAIHGQHLEPLTRRDRDEIRGVVAHMFRLDEDFSDFYAFCQACGGPWVRLTAGWGRLLRSPTVFEDVVKTMWTLPQLGTPESVKSVLGTR